MSVRIQHSTSFPPMLDLFTKGIVWYTVFWIIYCILRRCFIKIPLDNIPGPPSPSFFTGNFPQLFNVSAWDFHQDIAAKYGGVVKVKALLGENRLYVFDPKAMHHILVKDQHSYERESSILVFSGLLLGGGLLAVKGEPHRRQRKMLNPVFSIAHMREMVPIFYSVTHNLRASIALKVRDGPQEIELTSWMARMALELISRSGLGYSFDSLAENAKPHPYSASVKNLGPAMFRLLFWSTYFLIPAARIGTPKFRRFIIGWIPWKDIHEVRDIGDVMYNTSLEIFESKKKALADGDEALARQIGRGKDIMSVLMRENMRAPDDDRLDDEELIGQMSTLIMAAMNTTSNALTRILFLLAHHQDVQEKLRREVTEARMKHGDLAYDELVSLPYLDAVCRETLRLHPPLPNILRTSCADTVMPLSNPIRGLDGQEINEIPIPKNTNIIISVLASNRNPEIWGPDCLEWHPERWLSTLPSSVTGTHVPGIYSHLMTFGGGGRACIGFKFSQIEMKVVLSLFIESFRFSPSDKEIFWQMTPLATPSVVGGNGKAELPLKVSRV